MAFIGADIQDGSREGQDTAYQGKISVLMLIIVVIFIVLGIRLFYLQVIRHRHYENQAKNQREQYIPIPAFRGEIFDILGTKVAENINSYALYVIPANLPKNYYDAQALIHKVANIFKLDKEEVKEKLKRRAYHDYNPVEIADNITLAQAMYLAEHNEAFPGIEFRSKLIRNYPLGNTMAHIIGYVGKISANEYERLKTQGYRHNSVLGKDGVEKFYDRELRGVDGYKKRIVDAKNRVKREIMPEHGKPLPGDKLILSVDHRVQRIVEMLMEGLSGTVIVSKPISGEVVAMVSSPWYDPNLFVGKVDKNEYQKIATNERRPLWNKVVRGAYPASSTFKLCVALSALQEKRISSGTRITCTGGMTLRENVFKCMGVHGSINLYQAIEHSCNTYFYNVGYQVGPNIMSKYAKLLGMGEKTHIDLPYEKRGIIPSPEWKRRVMKEHWWDGDTLNMAIGQGYVNITPLGMHNMLSAIVNNGIIYKPHVVKEVRRSYNDETILKNDKEVLRKVPINTEYFHTVKKAMRMVVTGGTARIGAYSPNVPIAGKTGTAQHQRQRRGELAHSWFVCYAPYNEEMYPTENTLAVTVLIEHGGSGGKAAAPIAAAVIRAVFEGYNPIDIKQNIINRWAGIKSKRPRQTPTVTNEEGTSDTAPVEALTPETNPTPLPEEEVLE